MGTVLHAQPEELRLQQALSARERVPVVVILREPSAPRTARAQRALQIAELRERVLLVLAPGDLELHHSWTSVRGFAGDVSAAGLEKLTAHPDVEQVGLDRGGSSTLAQSSRLVGAHLARATGFLGQGVTVAVLDTGVERDHIDLSDDIVAEHCFCRNENGTGCCPNGGTSQSGTGAATDDNGHGTHVTGIITSAGRFTPRGIAPAAKIVSIKVIDRHGDFEASAQVVSGLDWILSTRDDVDVVNMSLGTFARFGGNCGGATAFTRAYRDAIDTLRSRGIPVFASSGNDASSDQMDAPGCVLNAISVGAVFDADLGSVDAAGCRTQSGPDVIACFSNASPALDILAPGAPVRSAWLNDGTKTFYGTSQATAIASGAAALLLSANPALRAKAIEDLLKATGVPTGDPRNGSVYPRIDVWAAIQAVAPSTSSDVP